MNTGIIASRYADALLKYVGQTGDGEETFRQAEKLETAIHASREIKTVAESPLHISAAKKLEVMEAAVGESLTPSLRKFLTLVLKNGRSDSLIYILHYFTARYTEAKGISVGKLMVSATSEKLETRLKEMLKELTGRELKLNVSVNPDLIGGFVFEIDDKRLDASISRQLAELRRQFIAKNERVV